MRRNAWLHEEIFLHPNAIVREASLAIDDFQRANIFEGNRVDQITNWVKPPVGWCKLNVHAAHNARTGRLGFGIII